MYANVEQLPYPGNFLLSDKKYLAFAAVQSFPRDFKFQTVVHCLHLAEWQLAFRLWR